MMLDAVTSFYESPPAIICPAADSSIRQIAGSPVPHLDSVTSEYGEFSEHFAKLRRLSRERALTPEGCDAPNNVAITLACMILQNLQAKNIRPSKVVASAEGGVAVCFVDGDKYADIESLNSGMILGVLSDKRHAPAVWEVEQSAGGISSATYRIRQFLQSSAA